MLGDAAVAGVRIDDLFLPCNPGITVEKSKGFGEEGVTSYSGSLSVNTGDIEYHDTFYIFKIDFIYEGDTNKIHFYMRKDE